MTVLYFQRRLDQRENKMIAAVDKLKAWKKDAVLFVREVCKAEPDEWQKEALNAYSDNKDPQKRRISLMACAGPGKSTVLAWCGLHFLLLHAKKGEHPNGAAVSVTRDNLKDSLWKEFSVWINKSDLLSKVFTWTAERIFSKEYPSDWFISARSWSKKANAEEQGRTLSGLHAKHVLYLIDESGGIDPSILRAAEQGLSNCRWGKIIQAGNPISHEGILYLSSSAQRHLWTVIKISGDPEDPNRSPRIDMNWAKEQIELYGRENPWVMAYILGQFPPSSMNTLLSPDEVEEAMHRKYKEDAYNWSQKRLGIDVARFGDDRTVIFPRQGLQAFDPVIMRQVRTTDIAARVAMAKERWGSEMEFVDDSGHWGHGCIDNLYAAGHNPIAVLFEDKAIDPRFRNRRTEMWLQMAEWVKRGGSLPYIPELIRELTAPTYTFVKGVFQLEPKDLLKKRIGVSPDLADALGLTFAMPDMPKTNRLLESLSTKTNQVLHDYNPFEEART